MKDNKCGEVLEERVLVYCSWEYKIKEQLHKISIIKVSQKMELFFNYT